MGRFSSTSAMQTAEKLGINVSAIQASVFRELAPESIGDETVHVEYKGIGKIPVGHTGLTIEEQMVVSLADRIKKNITFPYVADADHIPLTGIDQIDMELFQKLVFEARDRTFLTLDPHFCVDLSGGAPYDKFKTMIVALEKAAPIISEALSGQNYVVEVSIDECEGITTSEELRSLTDSLSKIDLPLFSIAPAIGFDKRDLDDRELRENLKKILTELNRIAIDHGLVLGIHSGDGKSSDTRKTIAEATDGNIWYKVSPDRQRTFFELLSDSPERSTERILFEKMFEKSVQLIREGEKSKDKEFASSCRKVLSQSYKDDSGRITARSALFRDFGFLVVREFKEQISALGSNLEEAYFQRDFEYIKKLSGDLDLI